MVKESYLMVDAFAQRDNTFTRMDARVKVLVSVLALAAVVGLPGFKLPLFIFALTAALMLVIRVPFKIIVGRMLPPVILGIVVFIFMALFHQGSQVFSLEIQGWEIKIYGEGLILGTTVLLRIISSVSILLCLSLTTPVHELGYALIWFRIPRVIVEILLLTYRYLFVLWDEGMRIRQAQAMRLGYPDWRNPAGWKKAVNSTSTLMAMVFIRAYDRAENTFSAMQIRGYNGDIAGQRYKKTA
ncbi:cobalt ECF transporter T component CbiQ [Phosphitispora fastidiosa]|uniref:cobalt ECF transporter T component CbiQ n=1 Tax=Phosphitispora fastidiosa TaxID=2837202 RepID=UPI001E47CD3D|nr:cobalt ECF transporter T component CbiQ [Phosphitispora fastidiosa]MBU7007045.1 cobalt/nickel transport system permease protein [Phosphitispora fastidiosa]